MQGQEVTYLVAAYAIIWLALFAYLAFIVMRIRGVRTELAAVQELVHEHEQQQQAPSKEA
ncbi:MAG TPA: CcmD family protein [Ktedonobacteraceae bacterium]|nr:CcmD family protein [Ktedonobacteraceae bacterium]